MTDQELVALLAREVCGFQAQTLNQSKILVGKNIPGGRWEDWNPLTWGPALGELWEAAQGKGWIIRTWTGDMVEAAVYREGDEEDEPRTRVCLHADLPRAICTALGEAITKGGG